MGFALNKTTLSCDANRRQDVVARAHDSSDASAAKLINHACRHRLELVLEDDEASKIELRLCICPRHLLHLDPVELVIVLAGTGDDAVAAMGV